MRSVSAKTHVQNFQTFLKEAKDFDNVDGTDEASEIGSYQRTQNVGEVEDTLRVNFSGPDLVMSNSLTSPKGQRQSTSFFQTGDTLQVMESSYEDGVKSPVKFSWIDLNTSEYTLVRGGGL